MLIPNITSEIEAGIVFVPKIDLILYFGIGKYQFFWNPPLNRGIRQNFEPKKLFYDSAHKIVPTCKISDANHTVGRFYSQKIDAVFFLLFL